MHTALAEIENCIASKHYYAAITLALTVPDLAAALASESGQTSGEKFRAWYDANLSTVYPQITANDCWCLRCGIVHQGKFGHPNAQYDRVLWTFPEPNRPVYHGNVLNDALNLDAEQFCSDVVTAAREWLAKQGSNPVVQDNLKRSVRLYPTGLAPYMGGMPIIS